MGIESVSWLLSLYSPVTKTCSSKRLLKNQIEVIEQFVPWNDVPKYTRKSLLKNICKEVPNQKENIVNKDNIPTIWIQLQYVGKKGKHLLGKCIRKVHFYNFM